MAREGGAARVVYAASSSAYGDTEELPKRESMTPRPKSPYALQKLVGEYYCTTFAETIRPLATTTDAWMSPWRQ